MKIKQKLIITLLAVGIIPVFVVSLVFFNNARSSLESTRLEGLKSIANLKADMITARMDDYRKDLVIAQDYFNIKTNLPLLTRFDQQQDHPAYVAAVRKLDSQLKTLKQVMEFEDIMLVSPAGKIVYVANEAHRLPDLGKPLEAAASFEEGKKGIHFSRVINAGAVGKAARFAIYATAPLYGLDGVFIGVLVFEIDMQPVYKAMQDTTGLGMSGETLIGQNMGGYALFLNPLRHDQEAAFTRKTVFGGRNGMPMQEAAQGRSGAGIALDYRGKEVVAVWRHIPAMDWGLVAKIDTAEAFESVTMLRNLVITGGLVAIIILILLAVLLARSFSRPIQRLTNGIEKVGGGDWDCRVGTDARDEIGQLSRAFDEMTIKLKTTTSSRDEYEREIAERTQVEESLRYSETKLQAVLDNLADGLISIDEQGIVLSFNPAAEHIFGYAPNEVIGNNINMLMPEPYHSQHDQYLAHYLQTGEKKIIGIGREVMGKRKDGSVMPLDLAVSEVQSGGNRFFIGSARDISERKAAEKVISEKNMELSIRSRYDSSYAQIMMFFASTFNREKTLDRVLSILAELHPFPVSAVYLLDEWSSELRLAASHGAPASLAQTFARGDGLVGLAALENKIIMLDGLNENRILSLETGVFSFSPQTMAISPICYQDKVVGVLVLASGKTFNELDKPFIERLCLQVGVALNNINQHENLLELSGQLQRRSEEIARQNQQLNAANRMKSEFLATMSHELRTPLNAIIGFSEVLKDGVMGELTAEQREYAGDIFSSGQHLLTLINDILDLSKIEAGKMELNLEPVAIAQLLDNSLSIVKEKAVTHSIKLSLQIGEAVESCQLDVRKGKQILFNLLSNAVKFTPDGGSVSLSARKVQAKDIHSTLSPQLAQSDGEFLELEVSDSGIGISEQDQRRLFQAFVQADSSLSRNFEGTGLGLMMVKRLAELHGGGVGMASEPGKGSTFTVWLPYHAGKAEAVAGRRSVPRTTTSLSSGDHPLVMIVEDEDASAELMRIQLEDSGYRTCRTASAEAAWEMLPRMHPDLITLDILLPGMDGWNFLEKIKESGRYGNTPVVIVSIVADEEKGFSLGASQILQKPVLKEELLAALSALEMDSGSNGRPMQILVADDDPKAVEFISRHLQSAHFSVLKAYGGVEAIAAVRREAPDLILLDLMMPDVSGFDVVHALKQTPDTAHIPILILTAKVITAEDRNKLNGDIVRIVEKSSFNHGAFINEVNRAIGKIKPRAEKALSAPDNQPLAVASEAKPPLILIVEDNLKESNLLKRHLEDAGYRTIQAANGIEALARMNETRPDLVTLDLSMPEMNGFTFLNKKAQQSGFANIPVVIVTGLDDSGKGLSLGANAILHKPIARQEILSVVASLGVLPTAEQNPGILLVDDDPNALKIIGSYFDASQYRVSNAQNGKEGLEAALASPPDLIVLDLIMPEMNGFEVIDHLKRHDKTKNIPIIVVTAKFLSDNECGELARNVQSIKEKNQFDKKQFLAEVKLLLKKGKA